MLRAAGFLTQVQDPRLVILAVSVCLLATNIGVRLLDTPLAEDGRRNVVRFGAAILVFSTGAWTTHLVSVLGFHPDVPFVLDVPFCLLDLVISIASTSLSFVIWPGACGSGMRAAVSGLVLASGAGAMHLTSMLSLAGAGLFHFQPDLTLVSMVLTTLCITTATWLLARRNAGWASVLLTLGVWFGHVVLISAVHFEPAGAMPVTPPMVSRFASAIATVGVDLVAVTLALLAVAIDHQFTDRLAKEVQRFRALANATSDGLIFERHGQIVDVNRALCDLTRIEASGLTGRPLSDLMPSFEARLSERGHLVEHALHLPDGQTMPVEVSWQNSPDPGGRVMAVRDLSWKKWAEHEIERLAHVDPLTGLVNRDEFEQALHQALAQAAQRATGLAVFYIDLDRFSLVSDMVGHRAAGQILIQTARRLSVLVQGTGIVSRLGRDAFAIFQPSAEPCSDPVTLSEQILTELALPFVVDEQPVAMTTSVGVAVYPHDNADAPNLVECAILAVCQAKREGGGRWRRFQANTDLLMQETRRLGQDLRTALKENQLILNYQPFVDTATLEVVGYEALLRWDHPGRGRISPADFIPLAEKSGLIVPIGSWVLAAACAEAASWDKPVVISVNLSPAQFIQPGIVGKVAEVLQQTGLPPNRLELEITESTLMDDTQNALRILTALKALGVKIAMDDFGTGYSSLSYLRKFPFDKIKIDRSFISDADGGTDAETIVRAIIAMGRTLRLNVTAEGVETKQQLAMLRALGCDFVQGYLLGMPCGASQLDMRSTKPQQPATAVSGRRMAVTASLRSA